jgi:hypothetical protein
MKRQKFITAASDTLKVKISVSIESKPGQYCRETVDGKINDITDNLMTKVSFLAGVPLSQVKVR